jgi:archaellum component FlaC
MARQTQTERLDRIEEKIDRMAEAIVALARAEEKIHTLTSFSKQQSEQIQNIINRIDRVEIIVNTNANTIGIINKLFWMMLAGFIAAISWEIVIHMGA